MIKTVKLIGLITIIFLITVGWFFKKGGGHFISPESAATFIPLFVMFIFVTLLLYLMGRPSKRKDIISAFDTISIYPQNRRRRVWISCAWGKDDNGLFLETFSKTKAAFPKNQIKEIITTSGYIYIKGLNSSWQIQTDNVFEKIKIIESLIKH